MTDSYRAIRTNVVLAWTLSNGALVAAIISTGASANITTDGGSAKVNEYMVRLFSFFFELFFSSETNFLFFDLCRHSFYSVSLD